MSRKFKVIIEKDEDGYFVGLVPELPGCQTQAKSLDELHKRLKEAIRLYLEVKKDIPRISNLWGSSRSKSPSDEA